MRLLEFVGQVGPGDVAGPFPRMTGAARRVFDSRFRKMSRKVSSPPQADLRQRTAERPGEVGRRPPSRPRCPQADVSTGPRLKRADPAKKARWVDPNRRERSLLAAEVSRAKSRPLVVRALSTSAPSGRLLGRKRQGPPQAPTSTFFGRPSSRGSEWFHQSNRPRPACRSDRSRFFRAQACLLPWEILRPQFLCPPARKALIARSLPLTVAQAFEGRSPAPFGGGPRSQNTCREENCVALVEQAPLLVRPAVHRSDRHAGACQGEPPATGEALRVLRSRPGRRNRRAAFVEQEAVDHALEGMAQAGGPCFFRRPRPTTVASSGKKGRKESELLAVGG